MYTDSQKELEHTLPTPENFNVEGDNIMKMQLKLYIWSWPIHSMLQNFSKTLYLYFTMNFLQGGSDLWTQVGLL